MSLGVGSSKLLSPLLRPASSALPNVRERVFSFCRSMLPPSSACALEWTGRRPSYLRRQTLKEHRGEVPLPGIGQYDHDGLARKFLFARKPDGNRGGRSARDH